eukprot:Protomagalhaensia_sp_Gyna_25__2194@NODE_2193_length_1231_cov_83_163591_g1814_i0_p1_GENE_NODE_2193_length_1231_cov_83_163591_g1814_i0NODE_2193_length_1231_cov_83_163591_g1814_i0_p1_ORF_typecomplete_len393_score40_10CTP_transf_like/PF01467_26/6_2e19CTP_transf_like/PF01467_26/6_8e09FGGAP_2/PF14312_6/1_6e02FGGAP_2/PF14312_6/1_8FGGAP_2/PF14312_6/2_5e02FAD_syn/PF06574_12/3_5FAD_syn/PF06574_12/1_3e02FAD_syn/PF06574_12/2_3e03_NODE_2193_length_1231_cov_83_163591_g1814_i0431179
MAVWIYTDGVFDLVHSGHFNALRQASLLGDYLCVGVNSDEESRLAKGATPILDEDERERILGACRWVARTLPRAPYETSLVHLTEVAKCDFAAHGDDLVVGASGKDCYAEPRNAGLFRVFRRTPGISSTAVVCRLLQGCVCLGLLRNGEFILDPRDSDIPIAGPCDTRRLLEFIGETRAAENRKRSEHLLRRHSIASPAKKNLDIVYCAGLFDIIRGPHIEALEKAKALGSYLIVGLFGDDVSESLWGPHFPILALSERMMNLYALRVVDEVILHAPVELDSSFLDRYGINTVVYFEASHEDKSLNPGLAAFESMAQLPDKYKTIMVPGCEVNSVLPTLRKVAQAHKANELPNLSSRRDKNTQYSEMGTGTPEVRVEL